MHVVAYHSRQEPHATPLHGASDHKADTGVIVGMQDRNLDLAALGSPGTVAMPGRWTARIDNPALMTVASSVWMLEALGASLCGWLAAGFGVLR